MGIDAIFRRVEPADLPALCSDEDRFHDYVFDKAAEASGDALWLGRAWDALQFVLTGDAGPHDGPLSLRPTAEPDFGGGIWAYQFSVDRLEAFRRALADTSDEALRQRFDARVMAEGAVYKVQETDEWSGFAPHVAALRGFIERCAEARAAAFLFKF